MRKEPIVLISLAAAAIIAVLEAVGAEVLPEGVAPELITIIEAVVVIAGVLLGRQSVYSPATYETDLEHALRDAPRRE